MNTISEIVKISGGYRSAVNVERELSSNNYEKVSAYIPTEVGSRVIEATATALNSAATKRSFLVTGTYGTGKSHLALVICHLLKNNGLPEHFKPIMDKIKNKWQDRYENINRYRTEVENRPFVIVSLYQDEGRINDALIKKLDDALLKLGLHDLFPETVFKSALKRIEQIRNEHKDAFKKLQEAIEDEGLVDINSFEDRLKKYEKSAFESFVKIHPRFSNGAEFHYHQAMKASKIYEATAIKLKERGYGGIMVLWDEFGKYLESSMENPKGPESLEIQEFIETCNYSHAQNIKIFTFLITHRSMVEYLGTVKKGIHITDEERKAVELEIKKISGRLESFEMKSSDTEMFELIDNVIIQQKDNPLWNNIKDKKIFGIWLDNCENFKIFPEFSRDKILETVIEGAYPLHPVTTCCLPKISERVAQNERTLFQFLSKEDASNGLVEFIKNPIEHNGKINVATVDILLDHFRKEALESNKTKKVMHEYQNAERLLISSPELHLKIAKTIAILNMVNIENDRVKLLPTPEFIAFCLNEDIQKVSDALETMSSRSSGEKILRRSSVDGTYHFYGAGVIDIDEEIKNYINKRESQVEIMKILKTEFLKEDKWNDIEAKSYNDNYKMNRVIKVKPVDIKELEGFRGVLNDGIEDGYFLIVLCETDLEIKKVSEIINNNDSLKNSRVLVGVPKQPILFSNLVRKYDALIQLRAEKRDVFGEGAIYEDDWKKEIDDCTKLIQDVLFPLPNPEKNILDLYWKGEIKKGITSQTKLENLASEMMQEAYPDTPIIARDELKKTEGRDTFKKFRTPVIDYLFREDGPESLAKEPNAPVKSVIEAVLKTNNILINKQGKWVIEKTNDKKGMDKVWDAVDNFISNCRAPGQPASKLIDTLLAPPFGIRKMAMSIIVSVPLRKYILQGKITIKEKESYCSKINGELIESIILNPGKYTIIYQEVGKAQEAIVNGMCKVYEIDTSGDLGEKITNLSEELVRWWQGLTPYSRRAEVSKEANLMRENVFRPLSEEGANIKLILFEKLPESIGLDDIGTTPDRKLIEQVQKKVKPIKQEFESALEELNKKILDSFREIFGGEKEDTPSKVLINWHKGLDKKGDLVASGDAGKLLETCRQLKEKKDRKDKDVMLIDLATQITDTKPENWNINIDNFKGQLKNIKKAVEELTTSPTLDKDYVSVTIVIDGKPITRKFKKTESISEIGKVMANAINEAIDGLGRALSEEEKLTVIINVLKEHLK